MAMASSGTEWLESAKELARGLTVLKNRAGQLGLYETMQELDTAVTKVGWEIDNKIGRYKRRKVYFENQAVMR